MKECDGRENSTGSRKSLATCFGKESFSRFRKLLIYIAALNDGFGFNVHMIVECHCGFCWGWSVRNPVIDSTLFKCDQDSIGVSSYKYLIIWSYLGLGEFLENDV